MKLLALDTSANAASVAIGEDGVVLGEYMTNYKKTHSERIMPMVDELLKTLEMNLSEIDLFVTSAGPGSFTGLRIGLSTIKAFAQACDKPIVAVPTTQLLAANIPETPYIICPIMDARAGQVYNGVYVYENQKLVTKIPERALALTDLLEELQAVDRNVLFVGDGVRVHRETIRAALPKAVFAPANLECQRASALIPLGMAYYAAGTVRDAFTLQPLYLRKPQAEREREERLKKQEEKKE